MVRLPRPGASCSTSPSCPRRRRSSCSSAGSPGARTSVSACLRPSSLRAPAVLGSVALVSASLDVDGTENLNERYVFYLVPLLFVGLALWIGEAAAACAAGVAPRARGLLPSSPVVVPIDRLHYNANFQSLALVPWISLSFGGGALSAAVGAFTLACGALWLTCARDRTGRLWLLVGIWMCFVGLMTVGSNSTSARDAEGVFGGTLAGLGGRCGPGRRQSPGGVGPEPRGRRRAGRDLLLGDGQRVLQPERRRCLSARAEDLLRDLPSDRPCTTPWRRRSRRRGRQTDRCLLRPGLVSTPPWWERSSRACREGWCASSRSKSPFGSRSVSSCTGLR